MTDVLAVAGYTTWILGFVFFTLGCLWASGQPGGKPFTVRDVIRSALWPVVLFSYFLYLLFWG